MDLPIILSALALVGIPVTIFASRRWGTRRGKVVVGSISTPLLASGAHRNSDDLKVVFRGNEVQDPHLVRLLLRNVGPHDITPEQFDGGEFLVELTGSTLYGLVRILSSDGVEPDISTHEGTNQIADVSFHPTLLPKGVTWVVEAIVSGAGKSKVRSRLINTDISEAETSSLGLGLLRAMATPLEVLAAFFGFVLRR
ncbi:hypothetical protein JOE40_004160 [Arthrobacter sp. PvP102]|uniref:hypothetical protein n=1 Tax=unclassified Arthrobacter TaxID=235627 RepID=UPI001AEB018F|nr:MULTISPECIES: hypothetical protein [unclassified Arthrobacter]MBP1234517.1 hypothetical protein [Arthrobacter sp. PvP103]MBP1239651.1 hypothetical protein [Arthrobacter sp. PvP102]